MIAIKIQHILDDRSIFHLTFSIAQLFSFDENRTVVEDKDNNPTSSVIDWPFSQAQF